MKEIGRWTSVAGLNESAQSLPQISWSDWKKSSTVNSTLLVHKGSISRLTWVWMKPKLKSGSRIAESNGEDRTWPCVKVQWEVDSKERKMTKLEFFIVQFCRTHVPMPCKLPYQTWKDLFCGNNKYSVNNFNRYRTQKGHVAKSIPSDPKVAFWTVSLLYRKRHFKVSALFGS